MTLSDAIFIFFAGSGAGAWISIIISMCRQRKRGTCPICGEWGSCPHPAFRRAFGKDNP